jgi:Fic family protein
MLNIIVLMIYNGLTDMIFQTPQLEPVDHDVLALIHRQRSELQYLINQTPVRWTGALRKNTFARAVQGSNSIEGYNANLAEAVEIIDDEKPETVQAETVKALVGYRTAMTYILQIHDDPHNEINRQLLKSLHFMMLSYDMTKLPGQWRRGPIYVVKDGGEKVYEGPDAEMVPPLVDDLIEQMKSGDATDAMVRGAMAHLNLAMIHPFKDGNGRMARALQTLLLTRGGILSPIYSSIEEWLGQNTNSYYDILAQTGKGSWQPANSALPWVRFCLYAHYQQGATLIRRNNEIGRLWEQVSAIIRQSGMPERAESPIIDAALGYRVRNSHYRVGAGISEVVASRDLKRLCDMELLLPVGEKRGRHYVASEKLQGMQMAIRQNAKADNVYELAGAKDINPAPWAK